MLERKTDPLINAVQYILSPIVTIAFVSAYIGAILTFLVISSLTLAVLYYYFKFRILKDYKDGAGGQLTIGFFHPYCDAGGGGERVLWCGIRAIQKRFPDAKLVIYTGDLDSAPDQIIARANTRFSIDLSASSKLEFIYLHRRKWVEAEMYPRFTLLGQSFGSILLGIEALHKCRPNVFLDTMGYAFTLPLFKYFGQCKVGCYVHYPTISTDMLAKVRSRTSGYNNTRIANSYLKTHLKLIYYKLFAWLYGKAGGCSDLTMVNSTWTEEHVKQLWSSSSVRLIHKIYPPCDVKHFKQLDRDVQEDNINDSIKTIVSVGQFRPEKDHALQIRAMFELRELLDDEDRWRKIRLVLIGGCRNAEDEKRVQDLRDLCRHLSVEDNVEFRINVSFHDLCEAMRTATIGLHTMWNEHFGIAVVEMLAAGLLTISHRSGGPLMDIIVEDVNARNGFLAVHDKEYAANIGHILNNLTPEGRQAIRDRARASVDRFSDRNFENGWIRVLEPFIESCF